MNPFISSINRRIVSPTRPIPSTSHQLPTDHYSALTSICNDSSTLSSKSIPTNSSTSSSSTRSLPLLMHKSDNPPVMFEQPPSQVMFYFFKNRACTSLSRQPASDHILHDPRLRERALAPGPRHLNMLQQGNPATRMHIAHALPMLELGDTGFQHFTTGESAICRVGMEHSNSQASSNRVCNS